jgi:hypothetical protein
MLHKPQDDIVRKGDIVWHKTGNKYFLIISSDCHLNDFWKKNIGFIVAVPIYKANDPSLSDKLVKLLKKKALTDYKLSSVVNPQGVNLTMIPAMDNKDDYIVMLKEIETFEIDIPDNYDKSSKLPFPLRYSQMINFEGQHRFRLNEPFLSALIERILRNIADIGVPDYSESIQNILTDYIKKLGSGDIGA